VVIVERAEDGSATEGTELGELLIGSRGAHTRADVEACQWSDPVHATRIAGGHVVRRLEVRPRFGSFAEAIRIGARLYRRFDDRALRVDQSQESVIRLPGAVRADEPQKMGRKGSE